MSKKKPSKKNEPKQVKPTKESKDNQQEDRYTASERAADFRKYAELKGKK